MKNLLTLFAIILSSFVFAQETQIDHFTKKSASTATAFESSDSVFISQSSIIRIVELSTSGSSVEYVDADGRNVRVEVKEEIDDSSDVAPTFSFDFRFAGDTLDSITVNGVTIIRNLTGGILDQTADSVAHYVADSITNFSSSPNYTASFSDSTVTIASLDSSAAPNGFIVRITYDGTVSTSTGIMGGGFAKRNIKTMFGGVSTNDLVEVSQVGESNQVLLNASRVKALEPRKPSGSIIRYDGERKSYEFRVTNTRNSLKTSFSAK